MRKFLIYCLDEEGRVVDGSTFDGDLDDAKAKADRCAATHYAAEVWESTVCVYRAGKPLKAR